MLEVLHGATGRACIVASKPAQSMTTPGPSGPRTVLMRSPTAMGDSVRPDRMPMSAPIWRATSRLPSFMSTTATLPAPKALAAMMLTSPARAESLAFNYATDDSHTSEAYGQSFSSRLQIGVPHTTSERSFPRFHEAGRGFRSIWRVP